jgi:voltage-gated potassium channel
VSQPDLLSPEERRRRQYIRASAEDAYGCSLETVIADRPWRRAMVRFWYDPRVEWSVMGLIVLSVGLLVLEVGLGDTPSGGWLGATAHGRAREGFLWLDVFVSVLFAIEYFCKLSLAPRRGYFFSRHIIDLLAILPILRVFRLGRAIKLLRLFRLLRVMRVGGLVADRLQQWGDDARRNTADNLIVLIYFVFSVVFGTVGILVFEKGAGSGFETLGDGLWWCLVTITTVGYGDKFPITLGGRVVATLLMFIGLSFYALLTGLLSTMLIQRSRREEGKGMDVKTLNGHTVVFGYNAQVPRLVADLSQSRPGSHVVLVTERADAPDLPGAHAHRITLNPTDPGALDACNIDTASVVVVVADDAPGRSSHDADARAILTILAIERRRRDVHTIVELIHESNSVHAKNAHVDEIVVSGAFTGTMLSHAAQFPGVSDVFRNLFEPGSGSVIAQAPVPDAQVGRTFAEAATAWLEAGTGSLLGYRRGETVQLAPSAAVRLVAGDELIFVRAVRSATDF